MARAITDEVFPPKILKNFSMHTYGEDVLVGAEDLLNQPHSIELMEHVWGAAAASLDDVQITKSLIRDAVEEYFVSHDVQEVCLCRLVLRLSYSYHPSFLLVLVHFILFLVTIIIHNSSVYTVFLSCELLRTCMSLSKGRLTLQWMAMNNGNRML